MTSRAQAPGKIFICYRREDTEWPARWLAERLTDHFGAEAVFQDVDSILPGDDFPARIESAIASCWAFLVLIGKGWLAAEGDAGRRLDDPRDWVRLELEAALARDALVIPVLFGGAELPAADELPPTLHGLSRKHAVTLSSAAPDTRRLVSVLDAVRGNRPEAGQRRPRLRAGTTLNRRRFVAGTVAAAAAAGGVLLVRELTRSPPPLMPESLVLKASRGASESVAGAVFDRTGSYLAWGGDDATVTLWDLNGGTGPVALPARHQSHIESLAFQPDGKVLASGDRSGAVWLWDPARRSPIRPRPLTRPASSQPGLWSIAFGRAGKLIGGGDDGYVTLWDVNASTVRGQTIDDLGAPIYAVAARPGDRFAAGSNKGELRFWDQDAQRVRQTAQNLGFIRCIAFSPVGAVAVGGDDSHIYLFHPGKPTPVPYRDHRYAVYALAFDPENPQRFASGGRDGILRLWSVADSVPLVRKPGSKAIRGVGFNPKGTLLAVAKDYPGVQVWTA